MVRRSCEVPEAGDWRDHTIVLLHGWPETSHAWVPVMELACSRAHLVAIDLPGIAGSKALRGDGTKAQMAHAVHEVITKMELEQVTLVGQDVGGMVAYAYLWGLADVSRGVIMDVVIPGVDPWDDVLRNPAIWHFAFHAVPELPEILVRGHERPYFDFFYDSLSHDSSKLTEETRDMYAEAYAGAPELSTGFDWYRVFAEDARTNRSRSRDATPAMPLLYLRGEHEGGDTGAYAAGLRSAGIESVQHRLVPHAGHFPPEESPAETWRMISDFAEI